MSGIIVDVIFIAILLIFALVGLFRGFFNTLISLLGFVASILIAFLFREQTIAILDSIFGLSDWATNLVGEGVASFLIPAIAILVAFILIKIIVFILEHTVGKLFKKGLVGNINRALGCILGFVKGALYTFGVFMVLFALSAIPTVKNFTDSTFKDTYIVSWVYSLAGSALGGILGDEEPEDPAQTPVT